MDNTFATFIETILGNNEGNAFISRASGKTSAGKLNINIHTTWAYPSQLEEMVAYAEKYQHEDVYLSPLLYGDKKNDKGNIARTPENALTSNTVYMDSDLCTPDKFRLKPSVHVVTSEGRGHDYWVLDSPVDAKRAAEVAHRITTAHKDEGCDPSGWSANKVLRMAGTVNTGHGFPEAVIPEYTGELYSIEDLEEAYKDVDLYERPIMGRVSQTVEVVMPEDLPDYAEALQKLPQKVLELALAEVEVGSDGYRSEARYRLLCDLFRLGDTLTYEEVLTVAWHAPACRKWSMEDSRGINGLMMEANKAQAEIMWEMGQGLEAPEEATVQEGVSLLTDEERSYISEHTSWIDKYVGWTHNKLAKQNTPYDRMNAWIILSAAFSDCAFIPRKNGPAGIFKNNNLILKPVYYLFIITHLPSFPLCSFSLPCEYSAPNASFKSRTRHALNLRLRTSSLTLSSRSRTNCSIKSVLRSKSEALICEPTIIRFFTHSSAASIACSTCFRSASSRPSTRASRLAHLRIVVPIRTRLGLRISQLTSLFLTRLAKSHLTISIRLAPALLIRMAM